MFKACGDIKNKLFLLACFPFFNKGPGTFILNGTDLILTSLGTDLKFARGHDIFQPRLPVQFLKGTFGLLISFSILVFQTSMTVRVTHVKTEARALTASTPTSAFVVMAGRAPSVKQVSKSSFSSRWEDGNGGGEIS